MLQTLVTGKDRDDFMESLTPADIRNLQENSSVLTVFTNEKGGILDDLIVSKTRDHLYLVSNAGRINHDLPYLQANADKWKANGKDVSIQALTGRGLIAIQGPETAALLRDETDVPLDHLFFMKSAVGTVCGIKNCRITRCGYTGEDGVEISVDPDKAASLVERLLESKNVQPMLAGLGARDVCRIEAGLCLYGSEIREDTTPIEASLSFIIAKRRRQTLGFPGAERIVEQLETKNYARKRVGLVSKGVGRCPRGNVPINAPLNKTTVGIVTSGCPSPTLYQNISMGYVDKDDSKIGTELEVDFGKKTEKVIVSKLPFVTTKYYTQKPVK